METRATETYLPFEDYWQRQHDYKRANFRLLLVAGVAAFVWFVASISVPKHMTSVVDAVTVGALAIVGCFLLAAAWAKFYANACPCPRCGMPFGSRIGFYRETNRRCPSCG